MVNYLVSVDSVTKELPDSVKNALPFNPQTVVDARVDDGSVWLVRDNESEIPLGDLRGPAGADGSNVLPTDTAIGAAIGTPGTQSATAVEGKISAETNGYDVVLLLGQSNVSGRGIPTTTVLDPPNPAIFQLKGKTPNKGTVIAAAEPLDMVDTPTGIGPGMQFARRYVAAGMNANRRVLLVPCAQGGTPLTRVATPTWKPSVAGSLYDNAKAQLAIALALPGARVVAALWIQGETDGDLSATGATYQSDFDALIAGLRTAAGSDFPFIIGQMVPEYLGTGTRTEIDAVHSGAPSRVASTAFVPAPLDANLGDGNHFNRDGQVQIAANMLEAYRAVRAGLPYAPARTALRVATDIRALVGAYSLRLIVPQYRGAAVTVRRSSDNTTRDIGFTDAGELNTVELLAFAGAGDAFVARWYDQSGNSRHLSSTGTAQPAIVTAGVVLTSGSKPCVVFDGVDDVLSGNNPGLYAAGSATSFCVAKAAAPSAAKRLWAESSTSFSTSQYGLGQPDNNNSLAYPIVSVDTGGGFAGTSIAGTIPAFNGAIHQVSATDTGSAMSQWVDGAADISAAAYTRPTNAPKNRIAIGGVVRSGSLAAFAASVSELVLWGKVLSATDRRVAEANQKAYFGTP